MWRSTLFLATLLALIWAPLAARPDQPPPPDAKALAAQQATDAAARAILDQAAQLRQEKKYTEALAAYTDLIATPGVSTDLLTKARLEKNATSIEKAQADNPGIPGQVFQSIVDLWGTAIKGIATLLLWIVILLAAFGIAAAVRRFMPARRGLLIDLLDLSVTDRDNGSRMLSAELARFLTPDPQGSNNDLIFESMTDFEGGSSASIKPMVQLPGLDAMLSTTANVAIGPLQFTPAAILQLVRGFTQPTYAQTVSGALFQQGTRTALTLQVTLKSGEALPNSSWQLAEDGTDARQTVLRRAAARLFLLYANRRSATADPNSLEWVLKGFDLLRFASTGPPTEQTQRDAAVCFQNALSYDPANWLARFNLSVISRQLGDNEFAIQNCLLLEQLFDHPQESLRIHMEGHPEFKPSVLYNRALALSKLPNWPANQCAVELLEAILAGPESPLTQAAKSARAACLLFRFDSYKADGPAAQQNASDVRNQIGGVKESLETAAQRGDMSRTLVMSRAVALNAFGYVQEAEGNAYGARADLELAVALQPDMVEAHINLGRLYRHAGRRVAEDWVTRARTHLAEALQIQPENRESNYQMGRLLAHDAVRDYTNALQYFAKAAPHSMAAFHAGEIYCNTDFSGFDLGKGIEQLNASVSLASACDFRLLELAHRLLDAAENQCAAAETAKAKADASKQPADIRDTCRQAAHFHSAADRALARVVKAGEPHDQARAQKMSARAAKILSAIQALCAPPPPPTPTPPPTP